MNHISVKPSLLSGQIIAPPSKSHSLRAILFASLAEGTSTIRNVIPSPDAKAMISACCAMGAVINENSDTLSIKGFAGKPKLPEDIIDCGNSGQVLRFALTISALCDGFSIYTGDHSIRYSRPMQPLIDGLNDLGGFCVSTKNDGRAPLIIKGPIKPGHAKIDGLDSQPVSGLLMATAFLDGDSEITVTHPGEQPWIDLTLNWLERLGIQIKHDNYQHYHVKGQAKVSAFDYTVPGDFSSIAYPVVSALITNSEVVINNADMNDIQGDKAVINQLIKMGAKISIDNDTHTLTVHKDSELIGCDIDMDPFIDAITIFAVVGCYAKGTTTLYNAAITRNKECDRIHAMATELKKMGADISETPDGLIIKQSTLHGANIDSYHDHRIVMSCAVAALNAEGETTINDTACLAKSYKHFVRDLATLNANIKERTCD